MFWIKHDFIYFWHSFLGYTVSKSVHFKHRYVPANPVKTCWHGKATKACCSLSDNEAPPWWSCYYSFGDGEGQGSQGWAQGSVLGTTVLGMKKWEDIEGGRAETLQLWFCSFSEEANPALPPKIFFGEVQEILAGGHSAVMLELQGCSGSEILLCRKGQQCCSSQWTVRTKQNYLGTSSTSRTAMTSCASGEPGSLNMNL